MEEPLLAQHAAEGQQEKQQQQQQQQDAAPKSFTSYLPIAWRTSPADLNAPDKLLGSIGLEWMFLYLWLFKDFIWIQNYYELGLIAIGVVAFWWLVCLFSLLRARKRTETYLHVCTLFWLGANDWWM
jgi:hypothetical protein